METSGKRKRVKLNFRRKEHAFTGGHRNLAELQIFTKNKRFVKWLRKHGMGNKLWKSVKKTASRANCATLRSGKKLARLERALTATVVRHYRARTRKSPGKIDLMLITELDSSGSNVCLPSSRTRASR